MKLMKAVSVAAASAFLVAMSYGCSTTVTVVDSDAGNNTDSGFKKDASASNPDGSGGGDSGPACGPVDVTGFKPRAYSPPSGKHQGLCTTQNISDYVLCVEGTDKTKCNQFTSGQSAAACGACIETSGTDAKWGPLVADAANNLNFNTPGCLDLASPGTCGKALDASYGCQDAACNACDNTTTPDYGTCTDQSITKQCKTYSDAADTACAVQFGDAAPAEASNCFPDSTIADPAAQDADWVKRISTYFCGQ